jgi:anti-sigma regulatory factor (Ser/Thr protein kinase)
MSDENISLQYKKYKNIDLNEYDIWNQDFSNLLSKYPKHIYDIIEYGFTEMLNNAIEHSEALEITIQLSSKNDYIVINILDNGEGIFKKIKRLALLESEREAIFQLSKGKFTTDPINHSGEGIFFTSRIFETFCISSGNLCYIYDQERPEIESLIDTNPLSGTFIDMNINMNSQLKIKDVIDKYTSKEDYSFSKTKIHILLAKDSDRTLRTLISRSQAKRIAIGLEKFKKVVLDFEGIELIGQGFADQLFRVFSVANPHVKLLPINTNDDVNFMIKRALSVLNHPK